MVKSVLGVHHAGLTEWAIQRLSAVYMAIYTLALFVFLVIHPGLDFATWQGLFKLLAMKIASILFLFLMLYHAWIGMWTVFTDYIKDFVLRAILNSFVLLMLAACFIWGILILWSV